MKNNEYYEILKKGTLLSGDPIDRILIYSKLILFLVEDAFLVEALGNSMNPKIYEGDLVIAKKQISADNGDIIICALNERVMIKRFSKDTEIILESFNRKVYPIGTEEK